MGLMWTESKTEAYHTQAKMTSFHLLVLLAACVLVHETSALAVNGCHKRCGTPHGTGVCQKDGQCLCWWGWTRPNSKYLPSNRIVADFCSIPCHYTHVFKNRKCVDNDQDYNCPDD